MQIQDYDKDLYFVAVKVFLRDGDKLLVLHDVFGDWDLPGGRIKKDEFSVPLDAVIKRKMAEELGSEVAYNNLRPSNVFFRVERIEASLNQKVRIFAVGYEADYGGGKIVLGTHMEHSEWVDMNTYKPEGMFEGGWLAGVQEYLRQQS